MSDKPCKCVECRIRSAVIEPDGLTDTTAAIRAMGEVLAEMLAHHTTKEAKTFATALLNARKMYQKHPRVLVQNTHGHA